MKYLCRRKGGRMEIIMKSNNKSLPIIILTVAILAIVAYSVIYCIALKPTITEGEFDFSVTYELNGETITIEDTCTVKYKGNGGYANSKERLYSCKIGSMEYDDKTTYYLQENSKGEIYLETGFCANCLMGDPDIDCKTDCPFKPILVYDAPDYMRYTDEETLLAQGVKLISWEYPTPIKNKLVYSHMSNLSGEVVFIPAIIALVVLILIALFVKREEHVVPKPLDPLTTIINYVICIIVVPFFTVIAAFSDITGAPENIFIQTLYDLPTFTLLCIAVSVILRRNGFSKSGFIVQFAGPAFYGVLLILSIFNLF